ncbi:MAG: 4Fe-4S dicluster domain-containing protein [bacterium]|nr:4Fe-4S dicluster domain-containing protein [bacterium]
MNRREFLKKGGALLVGSVCAYNSPSLLATACELSKKGKKSNLKWGMVIDLNRCLQDCDECIKACRKENNITLHGDKKRDVHLIRKVRLKREYPVNSGEKSVLLLCNHCDNPPCAQACPVQATYKRDDGIVIVDHHRCIGCRYCMISCPYNARYFNYRENSKWSNKNHPKSAHGVPESCDFCNHLLRQGKKLACVASCERIGIKAITFGNLNDPDSEISRLIANNTVKAIREDLGTKPKVYYIGL